MCRLLLMIASAASLTVTAAATTRSSHYVPLAEGKLPNSLANISILPQESWRCSAGFGVNEYAKDTTRRLIEDYVDLGMERRTDEGRGRSAPSTTPASGGRPSEEEILSQRLVPVLGTNTSGVYYDTDWGLFSSILAAYNNHWALRTRPDDWWNVVLRRVAQAVADHGEKPAVRNLFVAHEGKKELFINVGPSLAGLDYGWLFEQFSGAIRTNIKVPSYVNIIENDFSTTDVNTKIVSQVMLMSSLKTYFSYGFGTACGIPGIYMEGTREDWSNLVRKLRDLDQMLEPVKDDLQLTDWFRQANEVVHHLEQTYTGSSPGETNRWWSRILSWREEYGSGAHPHWEGWFPDFMGALFDPATVDDFPSGLITVPVHIADENNAPALEEDALLVAGTLGFTVEEGERGVPVVQPHQVWSLLLPQGSQMIDRLV